MQSLPSKFDAGSSANLGTQLYFHWTVLHTPLLALPVAARNSTESIWLTVLHSWLNQAQETPELMPSLLISGENPATANIRIHSNRCRIITLCKLVLETDSGLTEQGLENQRVPNENQAASFEIMANNTALAFSSLVGCHRNLCL